MRATAGFACDRFGPRWTYIAILICGAIPTGLAGTITNAKGLIAVRCFAGILGASLVPCEVWATGFFDKNIVGTANALAAGWGNAGGGITYYAMPAIFDSLMKHQHLTPHTAWRVTFIVPFFLILASAGLMIWTCPDTPTGSWSARQRALNQHLASRDMFVTIAKPRQDSDSIPLSNSNSESRLAAKDQDSQPARDLEDPIAAEPDLLAAASWELVQSPTVAQSVRALVSIQTVSLLIVYFCSFGAELAIMSILGAYYYEVFPKLGQTNSGKWASMFGLMNFFSRPLGGIISDAIYRRTGSLWGRKAWIHVVGILAGIFACVVGFTDPTSKARLFGLMVGVGFFCEAGNGAVFALVPHVHPTSNGT